MHSETWLEKATRLQQLLIRRDEVTRVEKAAAAREELALWLKNEFPEKPASGSVSGTPEQTGQYTPKLALTREEAAQAIGQSVVTIDRLTQRGLLHPSRATRRPVYPVWEIERFLRETSASIL